MSDAVTAPAPGPSVDRIDGLTVLAPADPRAGDDVTAVLTFRVGIADEAVTTRGITHLVEHLAVSRFESDALSWNGSVDLTRARFSARGAAGEVERFVNAVMAALRSLPHERLDHERRVLQIETRSSRPGIASSLLTLRFGLQGPGVAPYPEWGLEWLGIEELQAWSDEWFTASNAVLWTTAPLAGLVVPLPAGRPRPPRLTVPSRGLPAAQVRDAEALVLTALVPRTTAHLVAAMQLERSLRRLRHEDGLSYHTAVSHYPLSTDHALVTATADVHPEAALEAADAFQAAIQDVAGTPPSEEQLDAHRRNLAPGSGEDATTARLDNAAIALLFGAPDPLVDPLPRGLAGLSPGDVGRAAADLLDQALLAVPLGAADAVLPPFRHFRPEPVAPVEGRTMRSSDPAVDHDVRLVYGDHGVTHWDEHGEPLTVRFEACAGVVAWPDGSRLVYGTDGAGLFLDPRQWLQYSRIRDCVDRNTGDNVARLPVSPDRPAVARRGPVLRFIQRTVDRLPWPVVVLIGAVTIGAALGALVVGLAAGLGWIAGEMAWLGEHRKRVLVLVVMFGLIAALSWRDHRKKVRARKERAVARQAARDSG